MSEQGKTPTDPCQAKRPDLPRVWAHLDATRQQASPLEARRRVARCIRYLLHTFRAHRDFIQHWPWQRRQPPLYRWGELVKAVDDLYRWVRSHPQEVPQAEAEDTERLLRGVQVAAQQARERLRGVIARGKHWRDLLARPAQLRHPDFLTKEYEQGTLENPTWNALGQALQAIRRELRLGAQAAIYHGWKEEAQTLQALSEYLESRQRAFRGWVSLLERAATVSAEQQNDLERARALRDLVCGAGAKKQVRWHPVYLEALEAWCREAEERYAAFVQGTETASRQVQKAEELVNSLKALLHLSARVQAEGRSLDEVRIPVAWGFKEDAEGRFKAQRIEEARPLSEAIREYQELLAGNILIPAIEERLEKAKEALNEGRLAEAQEHLDRIERFEAWQERETLGLMPYLPQEMLAAYRRLRHRVEEGQAFSRRVEQMLQEAQKARSEGNWEQAWESLRAVRQALEAHPEWRTDLPSRLAGEEAEWRRALRRQIEGHWQAWQAAWREGNWEALSEHGRALDTLVALFRRAGGEELSLDTRRRAWREVAAQVRRGLRRLEHLERPQERWALLQEMVRQVRRVEGEVAEARVRRWVGSLWDDTEVAMHQEEVLDALWRQWQEVQTSSKKQVSLAEAQKQVRRIREQALVLVEEIQEPHLRRRAQDLLAGSTALEAVLEGREWLRLLEAGRVQDRIWPEGLLERLETAARYRGRIADEAADLKRRLAAYRKKWQQAQEVLETGERLGEGASLKEIQRLYTAARRWQGEPTPYQYRLQRLVQELEARYKQEITQRLQAAYETWRRSERENRPGGEAAQSATRLRQLCQTLETFSADLAQEVCPQYEIPLLQAEIGEEMERLQTAECSRAVLEVGIHAETPRDCAAVLQGWKSLADKVGRLLEMLEGQGERAGAEQQARLWKAQIEKFLLFTRLAAEEMSWEEALSTLEEWGESLNRDAELRAVYLRALLEVEAQRLQQVLAP